VRSRRRDTDASMAFARTWALELARSQISVNAIVPTAWTQMTATIPVYAPL
jgi:NAD(P)-dependent dehydrogenase (short-subunit alcohol dehydrogenase family)